MQDTADKIACKPRAELNKRGKLLTLLLLLLALLWSCTNDNVLILFHPTPPTPPVSVVSVEPRTGYAGTLIRIILHRESDSIYASDMYELNGYNNYAERRHNDSIWIRFPHVLTYTGLYTKAFDDRTDSTYSMKVDFMPYPEICSQPTCVRWWNNEDSVDLSLCRNYNLSDWTSTTVGDTIRLQTYVWYPEAEYFKYLHFINRGVNQLPTFLVFALYETYFNTRDTLQSCLIKIDRWDPHGIISGGVFSSDTSNQRYRFYQTYFYVRLQ